VEERDLWEKEAMEEEEGEDVRAGLTIVSVATKTNDDCDKHFGAYNPDGTILARGKRSISFSEEATNETCSL